MAAGANILLKRKAGAFTGGDLAAGEAGVDTTNGDIYFSTNGSTVVRVKGGTEDTIELFLDGGGSAITTGQHGPAKRIEWNCTITQAILYGDTTGSMVIDLWAAAGGGGYPTNANSITASAPPTVSGGTYSADSTLTGWTTSLTAGHLLAANVDSAASWTKATLILKVTKT